MAKVRELTAAAARARLLPPPWARNSALVLCMVGRKCGQPKVTSMSSKASRAMASTAASLAALAAPGLSPEKGVEGGEDEDEGPD